MRSASNLTTSLTLLARIEAHENEAWHVFTRLYGPLVYAWCRTAGLQPDDANDVGQDVFRVVAQKIHTYEPGRKESGAFRSWLWGITRFAILNHLRSQQRQPVGTGGTDHNLSLQRLEQDSQEPQSADGVSSRQLLMRNAIEVLKSHFDSRTWQAFWDMAVKGRPAKDIGDELNMTAKAVRQAKFRVSRKLRELLDEDYSDLLGEQNA